MEQIVIPPQNESEAPPAFIKPIFKKLGGQFDKISFDKLEYLRMLRDEGFQRMDPNPESSIFIRIDNRKVKIISREAITDFIQHKLENLQAFKHTVVYKSTPDSDPLEKEVYIDADKVLSSFLNNLRNLTSDAFLKRLQPNGDLQFVDDDRDMIRFFYLNGYVEVTATEANFKAYDTMRGVIWDNQVLQRIYQTPKQNTQGTWEQFVNNISGQNKKRFEALKSMIGYVLSGYNRGKRYAIVLTDSRLSDEDEANGRTGKTLLCRGIGNMLNADDNASVFKEINGRDFQTRDPHKYDACNLDTRLIHLNDVPGKFVIDDLFNDISDQITVNKKFQQPFSIRAKMILSSNRTINIEGESAKDRTKVFELADYYSSSFSPYQEFRHWFFDDWDVQEWARFDSFMIRCAQTYLRDGIMDSDTISLDRRTVIEHTAPEFVSFADDIFRYAGITITMMGDLKETLRIREGVEYNKGALMKAFVELTGKDFEKMRQRTFTRWVKRYCNSAKIRYVEERRLGYDVFKFFDLPEEEQ